MILKTFLLLAAISFLSAGKIELFAAQSAFEGKVIRIVVGFSAGGGFDTYSRAIARHIGKHIPGNPSIVVENMTGAGSIVAANHLYRVAKPDGLTIGNFHGFQILNQVLGAPGIEFDARKLQWLGVPVQDTGACALTKASGIGSIEQWQTAKQPVKLGGVGPGDASYGMARVLKEVLGLPVQPIPGYKGTADIRLAAESGEIAGGCWQWESIKVIWRKGLETGAAKLSPWFSDVKVHRFDDALIVTEAAPLVAYVQSMAIGPAVTEGRLGEFTRFVESELARLGRIHICKEPGLFEARTTSDE